MDYIGPAILGGLTFAIVGYVARRGQPNVVRTAGAGGMGFACVWIAMAALNPDRSLFPVFLGVFVVLVFVGVIRGRYAK